VCVARSEIEEERLIACNGIMLVKPMNSVVRDVSVEVIALLRCFDGSTVLCSIDARIILVVITRHEAIEVFKASPWASGRKGRLGLICQARRIVHLPNAAVLYHCL